MKAAEQSSWRVWGRMNGCATVTKSCGKLPRRPPPHLTPCLGKLLWPDSRPRSPRTKTFGSGRGRFSGIALRELAAGVVVGLLVSGAMVWAASIFGLFGGKEDWRSAIAEYTDLYTNETFSPFNPDAAMQAAELSHVGAKVGTDLTPENVTLPGLRFTTAFMLSYGDSPLGVVAYVDPAGAPVLLCILVNDAPDAPMRSQRRDNLSLAWWSRGGRSRLVIGRIPEEQAVALAQTL
jgi:hypothetical protein